MVPTFVLAAPAPSPEPAPAPQDVEFSAAFLGASSSRYDLSRFERGNAMLAGEYSVDLYVNEYRVSREQVAFREAADGRVKPCFTRTLLAVMNVDTGKLEAAGAHLDGDCLDLEALIPDATASANADELRLDVSIPQVALLRNARGYVDPKLWDRGVNAFTLGYTFNASQFHSDRVDHQRQAYLGLEAGLNVGGWRVRNRCRTSNGRPACVTRAAAVMSRWSAAWRSRWASVRVPNPASARLERNSNCCRCSVNRGTCRCSRPWPMRMAAMALRGRKSSACGRTCCRGWRGPKAKPGVPGAPVR